MKILAVGDIHGDSKLTQKIADLATENKVDFVVLAGDLTNFDQFEHGMISNIIKSGHKVLFVPGNHDSPVTSEVLSYTYKIKNMHGYGFKTKNNDIGIFGCSAINVGEHALEEDEITESLEKAHEQIKEAKKKIMITHVHPVDTIMDKMGLFEGSLSVKKAIEKFKPDILVCSHIHEAKGIEEILDKTKVINVSKEPKIIDL